MCRGKGGKGGEKREKRPKKKGVCYFLKKKCVFFGSYDNMSPIIFKFISRFKFLIKIGQ